MKEIILPILRAAVFAKCIEDGAPEEVATEQSHWWINAMYDAIDAGIIDSFSINHLGELETTATTASEEVQAFLNSYKPPSNEVTTKDQ